jgi:hypothetical protein
MYAPEESRAMPYNLIDYLVVLLPTGIAILGVWIGIKMTTGKSHTSLWAIVLVVGFGTSILTWISQSHGRTEHQKELETQKKMIINMR